MERGKGDGWVKNKGHYDGCMNLWIKNKGRKDGKWKEEFHGTKNNGWKDGLMEGRRVEWKRTN